MSATAERPARSRAGRVAGRLSGLAGSRPARLVVGALAVGLAVWAVVAERGEVGPALARLDVTTVVLALLATVGNVLLAGAMWRTVLADLGSPLPVAVAARVFFVGQIGKYVPGSVWPVLMQAELGRDHGIPRTRTATATLVTLPLAVFSGLLVVVATVPLAPGVLPPGLRWAVLLAVPLGLLLHPAVFGRGIDLALRLAGRGPLERRTSLRGTLTAAAWAVGSWVFAGLQVWALSHRLGADAALGTAALCIGGYALAWAVGFLVVVAPAGAGAREVALAAVLSPVLGRGEVLVVVLLSRVLFTVADLGAAGIGLSLGRGRGRGR